MVFGAFATIAVGSAITKSTRPKSPRKKGKGKMASDNGNKRKGKGSRSNLYGVFVGDMRTSRWVMTRNRKRAIKIAREHGGFVRVRPDDPNISVFDRPTFIATSTAIKSADFRGKSKRAGLKSGAQTTQRMLDRA